ncbi:hypothetical protein BJX96DRAFT_145643 [Aspergillus floccosus]
MRIGLPHSFWRDSISASSVPMRAEDGRMRDHGAVGLVCAYCGGSSLAASVGGGSGIELTISRALLEMSFM